MDEKVMHKPMPVAGYTPQSEDKVRIVNHNKQIEETILRMLDGMLTTPGIDRDWLLKGRGHIEEGFMCINRAVFRPQRVMTEAEQDAEAYAKQQQPGG